MTPEELAAIEAHPKGLPIPLLNVERLCAEVRRLREEAMTPEDRREYAAAILRDYRGVETPCEDCAGWGVSAYASTACWRGGGGGQALTSGVCDRCWGSGDESKPGANLREAEATRVRAARLEAENARLREGMMEALTEGARLTGENARLSSALDASARVVARKAARERGFEDCRDCEALGYHGGSGRCEAHR